MSSNHDQDNHPNEAKPVAFRTPLILALVTVLILLLAVSTCDKKCHNSCEGKEDCEKECAKKCESNEHEEHATATETHKTESATETYEGTNAEIKADTLTKHEATTVKTEEHAHH